MGIKMNAKIVLPVLFVLAYAAYTNAGRIFILDDGIEDEPMLRVRRDTGYAPPHPAPSYHAPKGRVGPVYTFVKTDPQAKIPHTLLPPIMLPRDEWDQYTPSSRLTHRLTSSGVCATGLGSSMEDNCLQGLRRL